MFSKISLPSDRLQFWCETLKNRVCILKIFGWQFHWHYYNSFHIHFDILGFFKIYPGNVMFSALSNFALFVLGPMGVVVGVGVGRILAGKWSVSTHRGNKNGTLSRVCGVFANSCMTFFRVNSFLFHVGKNPIKNAFDAPHFMKKKWVFCLLLPKMKLHSWSKQTQSPIYKNNNKNNSGLSRTGGFRTKRGGGGGGSFLPFSSLLLFPPPLSTA